MERDHTPVETSQYHFVTHMQVNTAGTGKNTCSRPAFSPGFEIGLFCAVYAASIVLALRLKTQTTEKSANNHFFS